MTGDTLSALWSLLGVVAVVILFFLRGVVVAGKAKRHHWARQVEALNGQANGAKMKRAQRAERATDFLEILARRIYYSIALLSALGLVVSQFLPLTSTQSLYLKLILTLLTLGATLILLWYWQGWDDDRERVLRKKLRQAQEKELERKGQVVRDPLTELYTRDFFAQQLGQEASRLFRRSLPLSCLILEVEGLEALGARRGEEPTQDALKRIGQAIFQNVRAYDFVCRYDSQKFAVALLRCSRENAGGVGKRVTDNLDRLLLREMNREYATRVRLLWGAATLPQGAQTPEELMAGAERDLNREKERTPQRGLVTPRHLVWRI